MWKGSTKEHHGPNEFRWNSRCREQIHTGKVAVDVCPVRPGSETGRNIIPEVVGSEGGAPDHFSQGHGYETEVSAGGEC